MTHLEAAQGQLAVEARSAASAAATAVSGAVVSDVVTRVTRIEMRAEEAAKRLPPASATCTGLRRRSRSSSCSSPLSGATRRWALSAVRKARPTKSMRAAPRHSIPCSVHADARYR
jgi:hypothetical protein